MAAERPYAEVIGKPINHSLSPVIHGFWLAELGIAADYRRTEVARAGLAGHLAARRADPNWRGCNVTMPLKLDALALADSASDRALGAGAANILVAGEGRLTAGNTDVGAVAMLLRRLAEAGAAMGSVTVLGSGGAARAVLLALHLGGIGDVTIQARNRAQAIKLAVEFGLGREPRPLDSPVASDGLIQATPLGMAGMPPVPVAIGAMPDNGWVFDLVTAPSPTDLLARAAKRGLATVDGIAMLVEQAAASFALLFGAQAPRDRDESLLALLTS